ncbi:MAG: carboxypeptidase regulatory-like domain-containing protein [Candidatus Heimdallarchaeota archaeon]|nr:carboxypeptidase regulatory-like domain-containing protein [Candidatus Heimdallarchaeota archaeon]
MTGKLVIYSLGIGGKKMKINKSMAFFFILLASTPIIMSIINTNAVLVEPEPGYSYRVYGYAKDASTSGGISGATVKLYKDGSYIKSTTTTSSGYFTFNYYSSLAVSLFKIIISHPNYDTIAKTKPAVSTTYFGYVYLTPNPEEKFAVVVSTGITADSQDIDYWYSKLISRGFASQNIKLLEGSAATLSAVNTQVEWLGSVADSNDEIVFAYSGHGGSTANSNDGWLILYGGSIYNDHDLYNDLKNTQARNALIFICSCDSGSFIDDFSGNNKFFVTTACDLHGSTYGWEIVSETQPSNIYNKWSRTGPLYSMWVHFFLSNLDGRSLATIHTDALSDYQNWWTQTKWTWRIYKFVGMTPYYKWQYVPWVWNDEPYTPMTMPEHAFGIGAPMSTGSGFVL